MLKFKINASHLMLYFDEEANLATLDLVNDKSSDEGRFSKLSPSLTISNYYLYSAKLVGIELSTLL